LQIKPYDNANKPNRVTKMALKKQIKPTHKHCE